MISKKILNDLSNYLFATQDFSPFSISAECIGAYPLDLGFTLLDEVSYYTPKDSDGIPYRIYNSVGKQYNPTRVAAYGLAHYNQFLDSGCEVSKEIFIKCADWFVNVENARYEYNFDWGELKSPWISCMAQGEAASVLVRAYKLSKDRHYLNHAEHSLEPLFLSIDKEGVQSKLPDGSVFVEEYPLKEPTHVLNGFLYAMIGLGDYIDATGSLRHIELFERLSLSLCKNIDIWCWGSWSLYEDRVKACGLNFCTPSYHNLQITQLKWLNKRVNSVEIQDAIARWESGLQSFLTRILALFGKVFFRLKNRAQR